MDTQIALMDAQTTEPEAPATGVRVILMENITERDRRDIGETSDELSLVEVARMLDVAAEEDIDRHGASGIGAGAHLEAVFGGEDPDDDDTDGEHVRRVHDPVFAGLPLGALGECRAFVSEQKRATCWDGHNHVPAPYSHSEALLNEARGR